MNMTSLFLTHAATTAAVIIASATIADAQQPAPDAHRGPHDGGRSMVDRADQNGDGIISYDEAVESLPGMTEDRFKHMDVNGDGQLEAGELRRRGSRGERGPDPAVVRERFNAADTDQSGALSETELQAFLPRFPMDRFSAVDTDSNDELSFEEIMQSRARVGAPGNSHRGPRADIVTRLDADGSGEVSLKEFRVYRPDMSEQRFSQIDADASGGVTTEELRKAAGSRPNREEFLKRVFDERDADNSGGLSLDEAKTGRRPMPEDRFRAMDADEDGELTKEEFASGFRSQRRNAPAEGHRHPVNGTQQ